MGVKDLDFPRDARGRFVRPAPEIVLTRPVAPPRLRLVSIAPEPPAPTPWGLWLLGVALAALGAGLLLVR